MNVKYRVVQTQYFDTFDENRETDRYEVKSFEANNTHDAYVEFQRIYGEFLEKYRGFSVTDKKRMSVELRTSNNSRIIYSLIKVRA